MCIDEVHFDSVLAAFLEANDMDVITTDMKSLSVDDQLSAKKVKEKRKKEKKDKSATLRLVAHMVHHKSKHNKSDGKSSDASSSSPPNHKSKNGTLRAIRHAVKVRTSIGTGIKSKAGSSPAT